MTTELKGKKPLLDYPCSWVYTVIGRKPDELNRAVREVFQERSCTVVPSRTSAGGAYSSLRVEAVVYSDEDRTGIFEQLSSHGSIRIVL